jgi:hypothetical protein
VDQLRGNADAITGTQHRPFDYPLDVQFLRNLAKRPVDPL